MVNRGGPSFSNDHSARRDKTPIQLTVALPARLSSPPLLPVCPSYFYVLTKHTADKRLSVLIRYFLLSSSFHTFLSASVYVQIDVFHFSVSCGLIEINSLVKNNRTS